MNKKLALVLLSSPTVLGSMLSMVLAVNPAHAAPLASAAANCQSAPTSHIRPLTCSRFSQTVQIASANAPIENSTSNLDSSSDAPMLEFSEQESDAAVQLFGCDCIVCINAIRQMRGLPPIS